MSDIRSRVQGFEPSAQPQNVKELIKDTGNIYESLVVISKRANQLTKSIKHELREKLEEFATTSDTIEEVQENKEQIEISKYYEKLPNPAIIATQEFVSGEIQVKDLSENQEED
ncbi:DNA-directed RNA polymerase subunit omega [Membranihabitans maritimus]|uniref:DNA-directed RNA polymerase subunit omega n=1 Tax=Membranihabitans maritimus TaxID=2904244 RepID=UPI001F46D875|nr:DNA-directed RNA polymerase subunit omega [Membranihabitans maritimus]